MSNTGPRDPVTESVAAQIRAERAAARMTQREVYEAAGMPRSTYLRIEEASRDIDVAQLARIAPVFGLTISTLLARAETRRERGGSAHGRGGAGASSTASAQH